MTKPASPCLPSIGVPWFVALGRPLLQAFRRLRAPLQ
jgi:hypothetical protein